MIFGFPELWVVAITVTIIGLGAVGLYSVLSGRGSSVDEYFKQVETGTGTLVEFDPVETGGFLPGLSHLNRWSNRRKRLSALKKGYVAWHLVDGGFSDEKLVKPEMKEGGNIPELEYDDNTYLFPKKAMVPRETDGVWVCIHRVGEEEPINLRTSGKFVIGANTLKEYLTLRVTSTSPGLLSGLGFGDIDSMDLFRYGILAIVGYFVLAEVLGGGIF